MASRRGGRRGRRLAAVATALALLATTVVAGAAVDGRLLPEPDGEPLLLLLLGSDDGPPRDGDLRVARADGIQLLVVAADRGHATFVSIPRDAWVTLDDGRTNRLNACLNRGPEPCAASVEQLFDLELDGYLLTSMEGFKRAVEAFGGLTVDVDHPVHDGGAAVPEPGLQHLTGSQALTYARDRAHRPDGDETRSQAQAELLALAHAEVVDGGFDAAIEALTILRRHTVTDLGGAHLARLAFEALHVPPAQVRRVLVQGDHVLRGDAAVVQLHEDAPELVAEVVRAAAVGTPPEGLDAEPATATSDLDAGVAGTTDR